MNIIDPIEFETGKGAFVAIAFPDKAKREYLAKFCNDDDVKFELTRLVRIPFLNFHDGRGVIYNVSLPGDVQYEMIGRLSKLDANDFFKVVDDSKHYVSIIHPAPEKPDRLLTGMYMNYADPNNEHRSAQHEYPFQSFYSLMQANKIYTENPFGDEKPVSCVIQTQDLATQLYWSKQYEEDLKKWQSAESRTSKDWIIIKKVK